MHEVAASGFKPDFGVDIEQIVVSDVETVAEFGDVVFPAELEP
jgi:hypothetical protein